MSWDVKENIVGQSCAVDPYSDRRITVNGDQLWIIDLVIVIDDSVYVEFTLDMEMRLYQMPVYF